MIMLHFRLGFIALLTMLFAPALLISSSIPAKASGLVISKKPTGPMMLIEDQWDQTAIFTAVPADESIYLGGSFTQFAYPGQNLAFYRLSDNTLFPDTPTPLGGEVKAVVADGTGGWYIGGTFTAVDDQGRAGLAHIRPDYSLDPTGGPPSLEKLRSWSNRATRLSLLLMT
jgi:hypothetical protein